MFIRYSKLIFFSDGYALFFGDLTLCMSSFNLLRIAFLLFVARGFTTVCFALAGFVDDCWRDNLAVVTVFDYFIFILFQIKFRE